MLSAGVHVVKKLSIVFALACAVAVSAGEPRKYEVTARVDKRVNFSRFTTYLWERGRPAYDPAMHEQVVAAVDRELAARGLTQRLTAPAHVLVSYTTVERTDIDPKSKRRGPRGEQPTYPVAALVVLIRHAATGRELFLARAAMRVDPSPPAFAAAISDRVAKMFERYPEAR